MSRFRWHWMTSWTNFAVNAQPLKCVAFDCAQGRMTATRAHAHAPGRRHEKDNNRATTHTNHETTTTIHQTVRECTGEAETLHPKRPQSCKPQMHNERSVGHARQVPNCKWWGTCRALCTNRSNTQETNMEVFLNKFSKFSRRPCHVPTPVVNHLKYVWLCGVVCGEGGV